MLVEAQDLLRVPSSMAGLIAGGHILVTKMFRQVVIHIPLSSFQDYLLE